MNIPLLVRLREARGAFVPPLELGDDVASVRADVEALQRFGFEVEERPFVGFAYRGPADRLCPDQIEYGLTTRIVGRRIAVWNRVGSTNDMAARASGSSANEGLVVLAEEQTAGRGRRGRTWTAPAGSSLLMSVLLFPGDSAGEIAWLTALGAVAVAEVIAGSTGLDPKIKWPNDVRVGGRKVAGILVERGAGAVVGIGLNVNTKVEDFPEELRTSASSLLALTGRRLDRSELARALIERLDAWYLAAKEGGVRALQPAWRTQSEHLGRLVDVSTPGGVVRGVLEDLDLEYGVTLDAGEGPARRIATGDVRAIATLPGATLRAGGSSPFAQAGSA